VRYQEWGWEVFQSIEKYCKTKYGYGSLKNVEQPDSVEDRMESFFLAETMKYLYLLFDPDSEIDILNKVSGFCLAACLFVKRHS
jgi:mannosyl-oligosaccharide alpha-1,2-mannosidase